MSTTPFLAKIGLSDEEQKVYLALLALGPLSAGEIAKYSGVKNIAQVKTILQTLMSRNYAYNIEGLVDKAIGLYPFREIAAEAEKDAQKIDQLIVELKGYITETVKHLDQVMAETEQFVRDEKTKSTDEVSSNSNENRKIIEVSVSEATTSITSSVDATKKSVTSSANAFLKNQTENVTTFETTTTENLDTFATDLKSKVEESLDTLSSEIKAKNDGFLADGTSALEDANSSIKSKTDDMAGVLKNNSKEKLEGTRDHVLNGLESFVNESEGNVSALNSEVKAATKEQFESITTTTEEAKKNRIDLNLQFKSGVAEAFEKVKGDIAQDLDGFQNNFIAKLDKIINRFKKQIDDLKEQTVQDVALTIEQANASVGDLAVKHNDEIAANVDIDTKAVEDGTQLMLAEINKQNRKATKATTTSVDTLKSSITLLKANYSQDINTPVEETVTSLHSTVDTTADETKGAFDATKTETVAKLDTLTTGNSTATADVATKQTAEVQGTTDGLVSDTKQKLDDTKGTLLSGTKKTKQKIASAATGSVDSIGTTANSTMGEVGNTAKTSIRSVEETTIKAIDVMAKVVEDSIRKEITTAKGSLDSYGKRFAKDAAKISKLLMEFRTQHDGLLTTVSEYPRPRIETTILYSKDAIMERLTELLTTRIKSNVTMVIPDPTDIPVKAIAQVKQQAKVTIVSKIDEVQHKGIIDEIRASDALQRIKIRKIGMQDMVGYSEYLAFDIDGGEEMLIAFKDESEKEWVGGPSLSDGFKNVVIGETLGRQAMSISRELK